MLTYEPEYNPDYVTLSCQGIAKAASSTPKTDGLFIISCWSLELCLQLRDCFGMDVEQMLPIA